MVYKCISCNSEKPCVLSGLSFNDDAPDSCPLGQGGAKWTTEDDQNAPYNAEEAWAEKKVDESREKL